MRCALHDDAPDQAGLDAMAAVAGMQPAAAADDEPARAAARRGFHLALVARSGHRHLIDVYEPVILELHPPARSRPSRGDGARVVGAGAAADLTA